MKFTKSLMGLAVLAIATLVMYLTGSLLTGVVAMPLATVALEKVTGITLVDGTGLAMATLAAIPRTPQQTVNPGGGRRLFLLPTDNITSEWPKKADVTTGEIIVAPTLATGTPTPTFVECQVSDNSLKLDSALKGTAGYQSWEQSLEVKIAGFGKEQCAAIDKLLNTEVVAVVVLTDGQRVAVGSSFIGLQFEVMHTTGAKGSDRREWTLKAKQDGYQFNYTPIAANLAIPGVTAN